MLHVLQHYLPLRKAILIASELVLLTLVVGAVMTAHLWSGPVERDVARLFVEAGYNAEEAFLRCLFSSFVAVVLAQLALGFNELYDFRRSSDRVERLAGFVASTGMTLVTVAGIKLLTTVWNLESVLDFPGLTQVRAIQTLLFALLVGLAVLYLWRIVFHVFMSHWGLEERVLILGTSQVARIIARDLGDRAGYRVVGTLPDPDPKPRPRRSGDTLGGDARFGSTAFTDRGSLALAVPRTEPSEAVAQETDPEDRLVFVQTLPGESLLQLAQRLRVDDIVVALENRRGTMPTEELLRCRLAGILVEEGEALYERVTGKISVAMTRPSYLIFNQGFARHPFSDVAKRLFDLTCAVVGILLTWPFMLLTALAVKLDSPGPALFRQERSGRFGEPIVVNKFRSMRTDAEKATGPVWAQENDPRITRVGRFIRKTRLDELPQLFNVLGGSMSMVGPRPERPHFIAELSQQIPYYHQRHIVKPGVTGWAQINYPYGNTVEDAVQKLQYDLFYIKYHSLAFDLSICVQTVKTVLLRRGT